MTDCRRWMVLMLTRRSWKTYLLYPEHFCCQHKVIGSSLGATLCTCLLPLSTRTCHLQKKRQHSMHAHSAPGSIHLYTDGNNSETLWVTVWVLGHPKVNIIQNKCMYMATLQWCHSSKMCPIMSLNSDITTNQNGNQHSNHIVYVTPFRWVIRDLIWYIGGSVVILQAFSFRVHSKWAVSILWRITTLPECEENGSKTSQQVPLRWVISSLYYIPSCLGEMLLWGNPHVTTELWRKQEKKWSKFYFLQHIAHHFFSCSPICNKTRHTEILSSVLQLFLLHKSMMTKASRVPQVPHITVLISAKRGHTHTQFQEDCLTPCTNSTASF